MAKQLFFHLNVYCCIDLLHEKIVVLVKTLSRLNFQFMNESLSRRFHNTEMWLCKGKSILLVVPKRKRSRYESLTLFGTFFKVE